MPTDLGPPTERKRVAQAQAQTEITIMLVGLIIALSFFVLLLKVFGQ
jgi:hypothetical protein